MVVAVRLAGDAFLFSPESRSNSAVGAILERVAPHCSFRQGPDKAPTALHNKLSMHKKSVGCTRTTAFTSRAGCIRERSRTRRRQRGPRLAGIDHAPCAHLGQVCLNHELQRRLPALYRLLRPPSPSIARAEDPVAGSGWARVVALTGRRRCAPCGTLLVSFVLAVPSTGCRSWTRASTSGHKSNSRRSSLMPLSVRM